MTPLRKRMTEHILLKGYHRAIKKYLQKFVAKKWSNILFFKVFPYICWRENQVPEGLHR